MVIFNTYWVLSWQLDGQQNIEKPNNDINWRSVNFEWAPTYDLEETQGNDGNKSINFKYEMYQHS